MSDDVIIEIANDCDILVENFSHSESLSFADFARVCKALHFQPIFGKSSEEFPLLASELLAKAKAILLNVNNEFAFRVGGLYLIYGLYFTQKSKSKLHFTLNEFKKFMKFTYELKEKKIIDAEFIFQKLFIGKAFLYCACSCPNKFIQMNKDCQSEEEQSEEDSQYETSLRNVDLLHSKYEELKQIAGFITTSPSADLNLPTEIRTMLDARDSDIAKIKSNGTKQGKPKSDAEEVNQGVIRRGIVNSSFQSQIRSRRMPLDVTSIDSARKPSKSKRNH